MDYKREKYSVGNSGFVDAMHQETDARVGLNSVSSSSSGEIKAPDNVASTYYQFQRFYNDLKRDHVVRFSEYTKLFKQYSGARPLDPAKLRSLGREYMSNINNGHARTIIGRYFSAEFNLLHSVQSPVDIKVRLFSRAGAPNGALIDARIAKAMTRAFKEVYAAWEDYFVNLDIARLDRIIYGFSVILREFSNGKQSWKFRTISPDQFLCPLQTETRHESIGKFCITHSMTVQELWRLYTEDSPYWNKDALGKVLWRASKYGNDKSSEDNAATFSSQLLELQKKHRNYGGCLDEYSVDDVKLVSCYFKEYDGKWSHGIIHQSYVTTEPIFFRDRQYESFSDFCQLWLFEPGQKFIHSVRGLGFRIYQPVEVQTRLDNNLINQTSMADTILVRTKTGRGKEAKALSIVPGTINDIGEMEFVQQVMGSNLSQTIAVNQYQERILERNVQFEQHDVDNPDNKYRTLGEVGLLAAKDAVINKPQVNYFYQLYDVFVKNTFKLIFSSPSKDTYFETFKEEVLFELADMQVEGLEDILFGKVKKYGLDGLPKWFKVMASRSTSSGSQVADIMAANRMISLAPFMTTDARHSFLQRATSAFSDFSDAELYFPDASRPDIFTEPMQKAVIENGLLTMGHEIPVSPMDSHRDECPVHFQECMKIIETWGQNQMDAITARDKLQVLYPHALAHFTMLSQDPWSKAIFEGLAPQRGVIENQFRLIAANAINEQKGIDAAREKQQLELDQLRLQEDPKRLKIVLDAQREDEKLAADIRRKNFAENLSATKFAVKSDLENSLMVQNFALENARKDAEAKVKMSEKSSK